MSARVDKNVVNTKHADEYQRPAGGAGDNRANLAIQRKWLSDRLGGRRINAPWWTGRRRSPGATASL